MFNVNLLEVSIIEAPEGMWLTQSVLQPGEFRVFAKRIALAEGETASDWRPATDEEKNAYKPVFSVPGESAYQIAVRNGYVGTETEWLKSLEGPKGDTGPQGPIGKTPEVSAEMDENGNLIIDSES